MALATCPPDNGEEKEHAEPDENGADDRKRQECFVTVSNMAARPVIIEI
jgi:hypothetical protein